MAKQKISLSVELLIVTGILLCLPETASAQAVTASQTFVSFATMLVSFLITILHFLAWFFLMLLDIIMDPQIIFGLTADGGDGPLLEMLHTIWQFTRDLVNIGFALGLIIGAVWMIVSADYSKIKEHLPKFVLAIVLVNFSWFIPRVLFDVSQVLTYTVFQIPSLLRDNACTIPPDDRNPRARPCEVILNYKFFEQTRTVGMDLDANGLRIARDGSEGWRCPLESLVCIQTTPIDAANAQVRSSTKVLEGLIVNHARLQSLALIQPTEAEVVLPPGLNLGPAFMRLLAIVIKLIMALIIHVAIVFPLIAMTAAFFIRIPILWVSMAFMPLVALGFAFPMLKGDDYGDLFYKWLDHFLQAVFLPVRVAIPFTIGFIMLNAAGSIDVGALPENLRDGRIISLFVGVNNLWQILWMGVAIFIIWHYSFKMLASDKAGLMGMFTEQIKSIGGSLGSVAMQLPLSWQFIPMPGGGQVRNQATGKMEAERVSIGQALLGFDPRRWRDEVRLSRVDAGSLGRVVGLQGTRNANPQAVQAIRNNTNNITQQVTQNLNVAVTGGGTQQARHKAISDALGQLRASSPVLQPLNNEQLLASLVVARSIDETRSQQIHDILLRGPGTPPPTT